MNQHVKYYFTDYWTRTGDRSEYEKYMKRSFILRTGYGTIKTVPLCYGYETVNFLVSFFYACKRPSPFFYPYPAKKPSFKPTNDRFIVAGICSVQINQPTLDFGRQCNYLPHPPINSALHLVQKIPFINQLTPFCGCQQCAHKY